MAAALVLPVSGPYTATYFGYALGTQNDDGFVLRGQYTGQEIAASDLYGMTLVEAIFRGINWRIGLRGLEFNRPGLLYAAQAFGSVDNALNSFTPILTDIGDRYSRSAESLILTATLPVQPKGGAFGVSANPCFIATLTALNAIVSPNSNVEYLFTSKVREAPFEFVLLPYVPPTSATNGLAVNASFTTT